MNTNNNRLKSLFFTLVAFAAFAASAAGQSAETLIAEGRVFLAQKDLVSADTKFAAAVAASSTHEEANALRAATRLLILVNQSPTKEFLDRLGIGAVGRDIYNWQAEPAKDVSGSFIAPSSVKAQEITEHLRSTLVPELQAARANLDKIVSPGFVTSLNASETTTANVSIDQGDISLVRALTHFLEYFIYTTESWNLDLLLTDLEDLDNSGQLTAERVLNDYPGLFTYKSTDDLMAARTAFDSFVTHYLSASSLIRGRGDQGDHLFMDSPNRRNSEADFRSIITDLQMSLTQGPVVLTFNNNHIVNAGKQFDGTHSPRGMFPRTYRNKLVLGTLPDASFGGTITGLTSEQIENYALTRIFHQRR